MKKRRNLKFLVGIMSAILISGVTATPLLALDQDVQIIPHEFHTTGMGNCNAVYASAGGDIIATTLEEREQEQDLNNDGDTSDNFLAYYRISTDEMINTLIETAYNFVATDGNIIVFELKSTRNLAYYTIADQTLHDTGIYSPDYSRDKIISGDKIVFPYSGTLHIYDTALQVDEDTGIVALSATISGDIVALEGAATLQYYNVATGELTDTGVVGISPIIDNGIIVYSTTSSRSTTALNYYDIATDTHGYTPIKDYWPGEEEGFSDGMISAFVNEGEYWGDLNGDGDSTDNYMLVLYNMETNTVIFPGMQGCCAMNISNGIIVFDTYEGDVGIDLNGNGTIDDCVITFSRVQQFKVQVTPHEFHTTGIGNCSAVYASAGGDIIATTLEEREQEQDLNNDGDTSDYFLAYYRISTDEMINTMIETNYNFVATDGNIIVFELKSTRNLAYYTIADQTLYDTGIYSPDYSRDKIISGDKIVFPYSGTLHIYDTALQADEDTGIVALSATISGDIVALEGATTLQYYNVATGELTDTGVVGISPIIDNGIIVYSTTSSRSTTALNYYDIATDTHGYTPIKDYWPGEEEGFSNGMISAFVNEGEYWGDLNGDGDSTDNYMLVLYNMETNTVIFPGMQGCCAMNISNGIIVFDTYEGDVGIDLNGNGTIDDCVITFSRIPVINIVKADYRTKTDTLKVEVAIDNTTATEMELAGYGPMTWDPDTSLWTFNLKSVGGNPGEVTVKAMGFAATTAVTVR